jgi:hypothetical protein
MMTLGNMRANGVRTVAVKSVNYLLDAFARIDAGSQNLVVDAYQFDKPRSQYGLVSGEGILLRNLDAEFSQWHDPLPLE